MKMSHGRVRSYSYARWTSLDASRMSKVTRRIERLAEKSAQVEAELRELCAPTADDEAVD